MDYKSLMGYGKKKKVIKEQPKSKKKTVLDNVKQELNEWYHQPPTTKRWTKSLDGNGLTEHEQELKEGPSYQYAKEYMKVEKAYQDFWDAVIKLGKYNTKATGDKTDEKIFIKQYNKQVIPFYKLMKSWIRGKQ